VRLEDDVVHARLVQQLPQQKARRTGADDRDLRPHAASDARRFRIVVSMDDLVPAA